MTDMRDTPLRVENTRGYAQGENFLLSGVVAACGLARAEVLELGQELVPAALGFA
jgi:hypothetical protein